MEYSFREEDNEMPIPYTFVRPTGRSGSCFANTYKQDAQFLLFLKNVDGKYTSNISALGPTNEQLRPDNDAWLQWVKDYLKKEAKPKQQSQLSGQGWRSLLECLFAYILIGI